VPNLAVEIEFDYACRKTSTEYMLYDTSVGQRVLLAEADCEKDLGVWISGNLKPPIYCCKAATSAMKVLSMIRRSFVNISKEKFTFLYKTYVKPLFGVSTLPGY